MRTHHGQPPSEYREVALCASSLGPRGLGSSGVGSEGGWDTEDERAHAHGQPLVHRAGVSVDRNHFLCAAGHARSPVMHVSHHP